MESDFLRRHNKRTRNNGHRKFFTVKVAKYRRELVKEAVDPLSLKILETHWTKS